MSNVDINVDGRTDGRTENRTPISHPATSRCDNNEAYLSTGVPYHKFVKYTLLKKIISDSVVEYPTTLRTDSIS